MANVSNPLPADNRERDRLAKFLRLIGSDKDGEALAAARQAHKFVTALGLDWADVLAIPTSARPVDLAVLPDRELLQRAHACPRDLIDDWDRRFLANLAGWRRTLSYKQREILIRIATIAATYRGEATA